jgi:hypothetical protein
MAKALAVFKLPPQAGAQGKPRANLVPVAQQATQARLGRAETAQARRA